MVSLFHLHPFPSMFGHLTWQTKTRNTTCPCILELQCLLITIAKSTPIRRSSTCYGYTLLSFMSASTYYAQNNYLFLPFNFCFVFSISLRQRKKKMFMRAELPRQLRWRLPRTRTDWAWLMTWTPAVSRACVTLTFVSCTAWRTCAGIFGDRSRPVACGLNL